MIRNKFICLLFLVLFLLGWQLSGMSFIFILNEVIVRFIRDGVLALALILPILAGMGINFAVTVGALCAQVGFILVLDRQLPGLAGLGSAIAISLCLALVFGYFIGRGLNMVRGKEMMATILIGFIATSLYQILFMAAYGTVITPHNPELVLSRGVGIRSMVDLEPFRGILDNLALVQAGELRLPLAMMAIVLSCCALIYFLTRSRLGMQMKAVGDDYDKAVLAGLDADAVRVTAVVLSTAVACFGQIIYLQNIGMLNVFTAHLNSDVFASAALLAGGATLRRAGVGNVLIGVVLFHALFIVSPQAGQNLFGNAALGEYFRSFVAYGTIAAALIINVKTSRRS